MNPPPSNHISQITTPHKKLIIPLSLQNLIPVQRKYYAPINLPHSTQLPILRFGGVLYSYCAARKKSGKSLGYHTNRMEIMSHIRPYIIHPSLIPVLSHRPYSAVRKSSETSPKTHQIWRISRRPNIRTPKVSILWNWKNQVLSWINLVQWDCRASR